MSDEYERIRQQMGIMPIAEVRERLGLEESRLGRIRHAIPFWWWLVYDGIIAIALITGSWWRILAGVALGATAIFDVAEYWVKTRWRWKK